MGTILIRLHHEPVICSSSYSKLVLLSHYFLPFSVFLSLLRHVKNGLDDTVPPNRAEDLLRGHTVCESLILFLPEMIYGGLSSFLSVTKYYTLQALLS